MSSFKNLIIRSISVLIIFAFFACSENAIKESSPEEQPGPDYSGVNPYPSDRYYMDNHQWIKIEGESIALVGITTYPLPELGFICDTEDETLKGRTGIPPRKKVGELIGELSTMDLLMPVFGDVDFFNPVLEITPELINLDPYDTGWIFQISEFDVADIEALMTASEYADYVDGL